MNNICTFEKERTYNHATETIDVPKIKTIKSDDNQSSYIFVKKF